MMALPRFLYVLQNMPHLVPSHYFQSIDLEVRVLLWNHGVPRIALIKLTKSWFDGSIALPAIKSYYWASQLVVLNHWRHRPIVDPAYRMDRHNILPGNYLRALYGGAKHKPSFTPTSTMVALWHKATAALGWKDKIMQVTPLLDSCQLGVLSKQPGFDKWDLIGLSKVGDMWKMDGVIPFTDLQRDYQLQRGRPFVTSKPAMF